MRRRRARNAPLSVRLDEATWAWLEREAERRSGATGVRVGPSSIVRALVERAAARGGGRRETIDEFRRRWGAEKLGLTQEFFEKLRDRSPGREVRF